MVRLGTMRGRTSMTINDDYVVKDYQTKNMGLKKFGEVGSLVIEEDLSLLGEKGEEMKKLCGCEGWGRSGEEKEENCEKKEGGET